MATIADVAQRARVSIATVSRVLSPRSDAPHPVNRDTAERVRAAAAALDFVPSALARGLASQRSGLVGLLVPDLADPHYPRIALGVEAVARAHDLVVLVCNTVGESPRLQSYLRVLRSRRADAVLVSGGGSLSAADFTAILDSRLPVVLIGRPPRQDEPRLPFVAVDNVLGARTATQHLVEVGARRIVHLAGPETQTTMLDRAAGYRTVVRSAILPVQVAHSDGTAEDGYRVASALLRRPRDERPDGIFAATDRLGLATLAAAHDARLRVPDDLAVIGFDDLPLAAYVRPSLSSMAQPARDLGELAMRRALRPARGDAPLEPEPALLIARLVARGSTGQRGPG